jgi:hypothetical protein
VENSVYVRGLRPEALEQQNRLERRKNTRKAGEGSATAWFLEAAPPPVGLSPLATAPRPHPGHTGTAFSDLNGSDDDGGKRPRARLRHRCVSGPKKARCSKLA